MRVQVHRPAVWLHKCVSDHAAVHRAPLVSVLVNTIFQVVRSCGCSDACCLSLGSCMTR